MPYGNGNRKTKEATDTEIASQLRRIYRKQYRQATTDLQRQTIANKFLLVPKQESKKNATDKKTQLPGNRITNVRRVSVGVVKATVEVVGGREDHSSKVDGGN